jgi:hypothetical protein
MRLSEVTAERLQATVGTITQAPRSSGAPNTESWDTIAARVTKLAEGGIHPSTHPAKQVEQLSGLLRLQVDVSRYQLRVELVSKVSESAVASVRKLQQNQ